MRRRPVASVRWVSLLVVGVCSWSSLRAAGADDPTTGPVALAPSASGAARPRVTPPPPPPPAPPGAPQSISRGPEYAASLAQRLGLTYQGGGAFVLLADDICRVRVYPGTHVISLDGQDQTLRGLMAREVSGVVIPGPAAGIIEQHVLEA